MQDTVKEVVIFKAHNGQPLVFCAEGEDRFEIAAERTLKLPRISGGLGYVLATVAGHLWGIEAACAIDVQAKFFRKLRAKVSTILNTSEDWEKVELLSEIGQALELMAEGSSDSALPARAPAALACYAFWLQNQSDQICAEEARLPELLTVMNKIVEESTRTIDTIRHQAKTVTVGISRPQREISIMLLEGMRRHGVLPEHLRLADRNLLEALSPLITDVNGSLRYEVVDRVAVATSAISPRIKAVKGYGFSELSDSRYAEPRPAGGTKRKVLRTGLAAWTTGSSGDQNVLILPVFQTPRTMPNELLLLHLAFLEQAPFQQKLAVLAKLGDRYDELKEVAEENALEADVDRIIDDVCVRDLIFKSVKEILG